MIRNIKKAFETFYFGYLSYKWKRLVRTILNVLFCIQILFFIIFLKEYLIYLDNIDNANNYYYSSSSDNNFFASLIILLIYVFFIMILSYVLEPFINKNTEIKQHQIPEPILNDSIELNINDLNENNSLRKFNFKSLIEDYLIRFIFYICIYILHIFLIIYFSFKFFGVRPTSIIGLGSILALYTSNILTKELIRKVKKINLKE
jgi:hypothetical protein